MSRKNLIARLDAYEKLIRLDKPIGTYLLLWPTLWGVIAAHRGLDWNIWVVWIFILGTILMRSAGCAVNDYADRDFDGKVERTRNRPLASGAIRPWEALAVAGALALCSLLLIVRLNSLTLYLSLPAVFLAASYPFTKRFLALPQAYLGLAFSFGIPMAFAAVLGRVPALAWALFACNVFWTVAYDTIYAMVDKEDDLKIGIKTSAITFGRYDVAAVGVCYVIALGGLLAVGLWQRFDWPYYLGWLLATSIAGALWLKIRGRDRAVCFRAFLDNHWIGLAVLAGLLADRYL